MSDKKLTFDVELKPLDPTILKAQSTVLKSQLQAATLEAGNFDKELKKVVADIARVKMNPEQLRSLTQARQELEKMTKAASGIKDPSKGASTLTTVASGIGIGGTASRLAGVGGLFGPEGALIGAIAGIGIDIATGIAGMLKSAGQFVIEAMEKGENLNILEHQITREFADSPTKGLDKQILDTAAKISDQIGITKAQALQAILPLARNLDDTVQIGQPFYNNATGKLERIKTQKQADAVKQYQLTNPLGVVQQAARLSLLNPGSNPEDIADKIIQFRDAINGGKVSLANRALTGLGIPRRKGNEAIINAAWNGTLGKSGLVGDVAQANLANKGIDINHAIKSPDELLAIVEEIMGKGIDLAKEREDSIENSVKRLYGQIDKSTELFGQTILESFGFNGDGKSNFASEIDQFTKWLQTDGKQPIKDFAVATAGFAKQIISFVDSGALTTLLDGLTGFGAWLAEHFGKKETPNQGSEQFAPRDAHGDLEDSIPSLLLRNPLKGLTEGGGGRSSETFSGLNPFAGMFDEHPTTNLLKPDDNYGIKVEINYTAAPGADNAAEVDKLHADALSRAQAEQTRRKTLKGRNN